MNEDDAKNEDSKQMIKEALKMLASVYATLFKAYREEGLGIKEAASLTVATLNSQPENAKQAGLDPLAGLDDFQTGD